MAKLRQKPRPYIHFPHQAVQTSYTPAQIAKAYGLPTGLPPKGVIAIVELGGGYVLSDIKAFCERCGVPAPVLADVPCDASNSPGGDADMEVALDIEIAAGVYSYCTGAPAIIRVYWATDFLPAINKIVEDIKAGVPISTVSISWGTPEDQVGEAAAKEVDAALAQLTAAGVPFFAAAGDNDSGDGESGKHVDFPASSPNSVGCGGTTKTGDSEVVWNNGPNEGTGGGYSAFFPSPPWQGVINKAWRMVPDVAANADPHTGYEIVCHGQWQVVGGTSAFSPFYAALFAALCPSGKVTPSSIWGMPAASFTDITRGNNGAYAAVSGPDPCTGLGVPNGAALAAQFGGTAAPQPQPPAPQPPSDPPQPPTDGPGDPGHGHRHHHPGHGHDPQHGNNGHGRHHGHRGCFRGSDRQFLLLELAHEQLLEAEDELDAARIKVQVLRDAVDVLESEVED